MAQVWAALVAGRVASSAAAVSLVRPAEWWVAAHSRRVVPTRAHSRPGVRDWYVVVRPVTGLVALAQSGAEAPLVLSVRVIHVEMKAASGLTISLRMKRPGSRAAGG